MRKSAINSNEKPTRQIFKHAITSTRAFNQRPYIHIEICFYTTSNESVFVI